MPPIRSRGSKKKAPPAGYENIEDTLLAYDNSMRDALNNPTTGLKKHETQWPIFQITHKKAKYIWDMYYERGGDDGGDDREEAEKDEGGAEETGISKELYDWLLKNDSSKSISGLHAKWKKQGYEKLCCLRCIQTKETNFGGACICRVPKASLRKSDAGDNDGGKDGGAGGSGGGNIQCVNCGCRGCASSD